MNEISNRFCLISPALAQGALLMGEAIVPDAATPRFSAAGKILFDQTPSESDNGVTWSQNFRAVTSDPRVLEFKDVRIYPAFWMTDGTLRVIGSHDIAPLVSVAPYDGGRFLVTASFQASRPLDL